MKRIFWIKGDKKQSLIYLKQMLGDGIAKYIFNMPDDVDILKNAARYCSTIVLNVSDDLDQQMLEQLTNWNLEGKRVFVQSNFERPKKLVNFSFDVNIA